MSSIQEMANLRTDAVGNILVDENGFATCISEGGLQFQIAYNEIDFTCDTIHCFFDNKELIIPLHKNVQGNVNILENENNVVSSEKSTNKSEPEKLHEGSFSWTDASIKLFLCLYKDKKDLVSLRKIKTKKILWQKISEEMKINGYNVSCIQVENKFKSLERSFKNIVTHNKKTGRNKISCPYERELTELLGEKHNIEPLMLLGNKGIIAKQGAATTSSSEVHSDIENNYNSLNRKITTEIPVNDNATLQFESNASMDNISLDNASMDVASSVSDTTDTCKAISKRKMGTTARMLHMCQDSLKT
ncbi:hypothetical protein DMN91_006600 [Ooceraea biroi]|uniref:Myb/SANT-like DNA-binding domain-containing protein n=1 Tax=Ooceraea biroi TaxID=2015173 RepID=A0A3L8DQR1_OOCBI|nr:hypothetical protein DMN91_006600 [Ooceraea biroi]